MLHRYTKSEFKKQVSLLTNTVKLFASRAKTEVYCRQTAARLAGKFRVERKRGTTWSSASRVKSCRQNT